MTRVSGLLLAAGAGSRMGVPKALLRDAEGRALLPRVATRLLDGGCDEVTVVLGARAEEARSLLDASADRWPPATVSAVLAEEWESGMAASLATGLWALTRSEAGQDAVVIHLVDLPDVTADVVARVVDTWRAAGESHQAIVRATYAGDPGHPVLLGGDHRDALAAEVTSALGVEGYADYGARHYLADRKVQLVECEDLASGRDVDRPEDLA